MKVLARNYRCPVGEIDLIALDRHPACGPFGPTLVFVEVKTRGDDTYTDPESAVDAEKRRRIKKAAAYYLSGARGTVTTSASTSSRSSSRSASRRR